MLKRWSTVGAVLLLVILMTVAPASAKKGGTDRPFTATLDGQITFDFGPEAAKRCGPYEDGAPFSVLTITDAAGNAAHMGKVDAAFWHCPRESGHDNGHLRLTAATGDEMRQNSEIPRPTASKAVSQTPARPARSR